MKAKHVASIDTRLFAVSVVQTERKVLLVSYVRYVTGEGLGPLC